jgi:hypothetical protein
MERLFALCLRFYPAGYRELFCDEMLDVYCEGLQAAVACGRIAEARFVSREVLGALFGACREHSRVHLGDGFLEIFSVRRFAMRSANKFPISALVFMILSLLAVVYTIAQAEALSLSIRQDNPILELRPVHFVLPGGLLIMWLIAGILGIAGWAIAAALRRSGAERLSRTETWSSAK